jgi:hypothetical protein
MVPPGKYKVTLAKRVGEAVTPLGDPQVIEVVPPG